MYAEFRARYPTGSLISDLLESDRGRYVVRVSVQAHGVVLATGLAAAESVEEAEDRARLRSLEALGTLRIDDRGQAHLLDPAAIDADYLPSAESPEVALREAADARRDRAAFGASGRSSLAAEPAGEGRAKARDRRSLPERAGVAAGWEEPPETQLRFQAFADLPEDLPEDLPGHLPDRRAGGPWPGQSPQAPPARDPSWASPPEPPPGYGPDSGPDNSPDNNLDSGPDRAPDAADRADLPDSHRQDPDLANPGRPAPGRPESPVEESPVEELPAIAGLPDEDPAPDFPPDPEFDRAPNQPLGRSPSESPPESPPKSSPELEPASEGWFEPFERAEADPDSAPASLPEPPPKQSSGRTAKPSPPKRKGDRPAEPPSAPVDLSDAIARIDLLMDLLGWTKKQGVEYLRNTYGKRTRAQLTDEELLEFLDYLQALADGPEAGL